MVVLHQHGADGTRRRQQGQQRCILIRGDSGKDDLNGRELRVLIRSLARRRKSGLTLHHEVVAANREVGEDAA
jgi:hypothetical protein